MSKRVISLLLCLTMIITVLVACSKPQYTTYDAYHNPLADTDVGGSDTLAVNESDETITLENEKVRIVFHRVNGSIKEYVNKETKQYLVKDAAADSPFLINYSNAEVNNGSFSYSVTEDTEERIEIQFVWTIRNDTKLITHSRLEKESDTICFDVAIEGNVYDNYIISVEYPILNGITELCEGGNDQFVSPVATGFLFDNPASTFNSDEYSFQGITKSMGMYPSGWEYPMQFMAYITKNVGGFYVGTTDGGSTIKSFTFYGTGGNKLHAGVHHYLDDIAEEKVTFDYEIQISNLTKGYWQEAGDRYFQFAKAQEWMQKGKLEDREDINTALFEDTVLVNFGITGNNSGTTPNSITEFAEEQRAKLYDLFDETLEGNILNIYLNFWQNNQVSNEFNAAWDTIFPANVDGEFQNRVTERGDQVILFEFNTLYNTNYRLFTDVNTRWKSYAIKNIVGNELLFTHSTDSDFRQWWYVCPSVEEWIKFCVDKDEELLKTYSANGLYHDVGTAAVAPLQCYDTSHPHGTRVNVIYDYVEIERLSKELSSGYGQHSVGQELIYEQLLPYVDYFQARANGGLLSWMENDRFRELLETGEAMKVPLFEYVYHAYGGLRMDGFMMPYEEMGDGYYYAMAYTALNGGIPEYNYEFSYMAAVVDKVHTPYLEFINELGAARTDYGKEFLVYGTMKKGPTVSKETVTYEYYNNNVTHSSGILSGEATFERVISSAFEHDSKIGIFLMNIAEEDMTVNFVLEAARLYGVEEGQIKIYNSETGIYTKLADIKEGTANCSVKLPSREVVMLVIDKE